MIHTDKSQYRSLNNKKCIVKCAASERIICVSRHHYQKLASLSSISRIVIYCLFCVSCSLELWLQTQRQVQSFSRVKSKWNNFYFLSFCSSRQYSQQNLNIQQNGLWSFLCKMGYDFHQLHLCGKFWIEEKLVKKVLQST